MEFKEFTNPEEADYDIKMSQEEKVTPAINPHYDELINLLGLPEDIDEDKFKDKYGITMAEYLNPTEETIEKVREKLGNKHR